jgi:hypothetical protein
MPKASRETKCRCGKPIRAGLTWCDDCRRRVRREAAKHAARSRKRVTLARRFDAHVITPEEYAEAPEWTDEQIARADLHEGGKLIRKGKR